MAAEGFRERINGLFRRRDDQDASGSQSAGPDRLPGPVTVPDLGPSTVGVGVTGPVDPDSENARTGVALDTLRDTVRAAGRQLPTVLTSRLRHVDDLLREVLATVVARGASTEQHYLLDAVVTDYLPDPFRTYVALPDRDRTDDAQATRVFAEQLRLLEETIHDMHNQIRIGAIEELSTHGRFLADKFAEPDAGLVLGSAGSTGSGGSTGSAGSTRSGAPNGVGR